MNWQLPFSKWLPEYKNPGIIRADVLAGLTGAIVVMPQGIAFALLAGLLIMQKQCLEALLQLRQ